jgi:ribonuclease Z
LLFEDKKLEIYSFPLQHRVPTCGFLFKEKKASLKIKKEMIERYKLSIEQIKKIRNGEDLKINSQQIPNKVLTYEPKPPRSYAYCSDTQYSKNLYGFFQDVDLLYTECTFMQDMQEQAEIKYHLSTADASRIAKESNCKKLLVGHLSARYKDTGQFEKELKALYAESNIVNDLEEYHVRD